MLTFAGIVLIAVALRHVVHELFHSERSGTISRALMHVMWRTRYHRKAIHHAGPAMLIAVGASWTVMLAEDGRDATRRRGRAGVRARAHHRLDYLGAVDLPRDHLLDRSVS